jgi:hypothetical protein
MKPDDLKALSDSDLAQLRAAAESEQKERAEKRKQETIAKIKELARSIEVDVRIAGVRGRPPKGKEERGKTGAGAGR